MAKTTLYFQSPRLLSELYCGDEKLLQEAEAVLGAHLVTREDWIKVEADEAALAKAKAFFDLLEAGRRNGLRITRTDFRNVLREVSEGRAEQIRGVFDAAMVINLKRKSVIPKTINQKTYLEAIAKRSVVFGIGPAGTGKTYLAVAAALNALQEERVERIILTRPAVEAGEALGFLPGDLTEKIQPYLLPLYDAIYEMLGRSDGRRLVGLESDRERRDDRQAKIEIAPLAYMRGRTLSNAFIILDEAQNTTPEQMMMFLTRLGEGSRMVVTGDKTQIDLPRHKYSGLKEAEHVLANVRGIAFHYFDGRDVVRHPLVQSIIDAYDAYDRKTGAHSPLEVAKD